MNKGLSRKTSVSVLILPSLMLLGAGLRFYQLDRTLGGGDENQILQQYSDAPLKYIATTYFFGGHHVFHTLLLRLIIMAFGDENSIAIRFPVFAFGVACLWTIYKTAFLLFNSALVARLSLLFAAICPVHIYYSQTARGYSLMMFFSIATVFAALKLLDSASRALWGTVFVLCGALSVYVIPTNVYFIAGLATWIFPVLLVPRFAAEYGARGSSARQKAATFLALFALTAILTYALYLPLVGQVIAEAKNYHLAHETETSKLVIAARMPRETLALIFPGLMACFLPFLAAGMIWGDAVRRSYRLLPIFVFFPPLIVPLLTGVSGYPRSYLYNLPLLIIFLAGGIARAARFLEDTAKRRATAGQEPGDDVKADSRPRVSARRFPLLTGPGGALAGLCVLYALASLKVVFYEHYPSIKVADGILYKQRVRENSRPLDLILIAKPSHYWYAKKIFQYNARNIFLLNKLEGVKIIVPDDFNLDDYSVPSLDKGIHVFKNLFASKTPATRDVTWGRKLVTLAEGNSAAVLPEDFEASAEWKIVSGQGKFSGLSQFRLAGNYSLSMEASSDDVFVLEAPVKNEVEIRKPSLIVLMRSELSLTAAPSLVSNSTIVSRIILEDQPGDHYPFVVPMGSANDGISLNFHDDSTGGNSLPWKGMAFVGWAPQGKYSMKIQMASIKGGTTIYDGLRIFVIELAGD